MHHYYTDKQQHGWVSHNCKPSSKKKWKPKSLHCFFFSAEQLTRVTLSRRILLCFLCFSLSYFLTDTNTHSCMPTYKVLFCFPQHHESVSSSFSSFVFSFFLWLYFCSVDRLVSVVLYRLTVCFRLCFPTIVLYHYRACLWMRVCWLYCL